MKIGIAGAGGVGGYFGSFLTAAGFDTHFLARGRHRHVMAEEGLQIHSGQGSFRVLVHATPEPEEIGPVDLLLFCVKSYDTSTAAVQISPMVAEDTVIVSLQNGVDNVEKLMDIHGEEKVLAGTAFIEASIASPGVILHRGRPGRIVFGEVCRRSSGRSLDILHAFCRAGIEAELSEDITKVLWSKFLFICGVHGPSTVTRSPLGQVRTCPETRELMIGLMREVDTVARRLGISLGEDAVERCVELADSYNPQFRCSMLRDLEWKRPMEVEALNGMVVGLGRELHVETPLNQSICACLSLENQKILNPFWT